MAIGNTGVVHVLYEEYHASNGAEGADEVYWVTTAPGAQWPTPEAVTDVLPGQSSGRPSLAMDQSGVLHAVWPITSWDVGTEWWYSARQPSSDWRAPSRVETQSGEDVLANYIGGDGGLSPVLLVSPYGPPSLLWRGENSYGTEDVFWAQRTTAGSWTEPENVSNHNHTYDSYVSYPAAAVDGSGTVHAVWGSDTSGLWYATTPISHTAWISPGLLSSGRWHQNHPCVAGASDDSIHLLLQHSSGLLYGRKPAGAAWNLPTSIVSGEYIGVTAGRSALAADGSGGAHAVWYGDGMLKYMVHEGAGWSASEVVASSTILGGDVRDLSAAADPANGIHILWDQGSPRNQVWYVTSNHDYYEMGTK